MNVRQTRYNLGLDYSSLQKRKFRKDCFIHERWWLSRWPLGRWLGTTLQKKIVVPKITCYKKILFQIFFLPNGDRLQHQRSSQKLGVEELSDNVLRLSKKCSRPLVSIKVANRSIVQHMGNGHRLQRQRLVQKFWVKNLSKQCLMTFLTMFQASSVYKSCKWKLSAA